MITTENLPVGYKPYNHLNFCSNIINGGGHIFAVGKTIPLLVGVGSAPRVWLQAVAAPGSKEFVSIVEDSISTHPAVSVETIGSKIIVSVHGKIVLKAETKGNLNAVVSEVNFRPLGLNVVGSPMGLSLGGMQLSRNTFTNVAIAFGLGA